jgi:hypothetical protein
VTGKKVTGKKVTEKSHKFAWVIKSQEKSNRKKVPIYIFSLELKYLGKIPEQFNVIKS